MSADNLAHAHLSANMQGNVPKELLVSAQADLPANKYANVRMNAQGVNPNKEKNDAAGLPGIGMLEEVEPESFRVWSREEAAAWRKRNPSLSPWRVVMLQAVAGLGCGLLTLLITHRESAAWSALYGAAAAAVPSALLARGMSRSYADVRGAAGQAVFRFMFWEMVKIGVAVAMLVGAPKVVVGLSWPAMLVAMIVCTKMNWLAMLWQRGSKKKKTTIPRI